MEDGAADDFLRADFFALFGLPRRFAVDVDDLESRYRQLQRLAHPDRWAAAADGEKLRAAQLSARLNEARDTLRAPLARAAYLLKLSGVDALAEDNNAMPPAFLVEALEWREELEEAAGDVAALSGLRAQCQKRLDGEFENLARFLDDDKDDEKAAAAARRAQYHEKFLLEAARLMEECESGK